MLSSFPDLIDSHLFPLNSYTSGDIINIRIKKINEQ